MHQLLTPADYRRVPWKNGGGRTLEIASEPPGAGTAAFVWRVSVADVERDGPFSAFPGVDRTLVLLAGNGMRLIGGGSALEVGSAYEPVRFPGERPLDCALLDGPARDYNLMTRRDAARGHVVVVRDAGRAIEPAQAVVCLAAAGACECLIAGHPPIPVPTWHALRIDAEPGTVTPSLRVFPTDANAVALVAVVHGHAAAS